MLKASEIILNYIITTIYTNYIADINTQLINKLQQSYKIIKKYYNKNYLNKKF